MRYNAIQRSAFLTITIDRKHAFLCFYILSFLRAKCLIGWILRDVCSSQFSSRTYLEHENFARRFVYIKVAFGWIFGINAGSSQEVNYIIWSIYISIIGCYLLKWKRKCVRKNYPQCRKCFLESNDWISNFIKSFPCQN